MPVLSRVAGCLLLLGPVVAPANLGAALPAQEQAAAQPQRADQAEAQSPPCPNSGQKPAKQKSPLAQDTGAAVGGTAGQIAGAALLGPIGAAAVAVLGSHAGKKAGGVVKTKKGAESQDVPAQCAQPSAENSAPAQQGENASSPAQPQSPPASGTN